jgi:hypothetical protein
MMQLQLLVFQIVQRLLRRQLILHLTAINSIQGTFTATTADEYLVLQSSSSSLSNLPVNGVVYNAGAVLGNATLYRETVQQHLLHQD